MDQPARYCRDRKQKQPEQQQKQQHQQQRHQQRSAMNESICVTENPFIKEYMKSIQPARDTISAQWSECSRDKSNLNIEAPASNDEVNTLAPLHICAYKVLVHRVLLTYNVDALDGQSVG